MAFMTLILLFAFYPVVAVGLVVLCAIVFALFSILPKLRRTVTPPLPQRQPVAVATSGLPIVAEAPPASLGLPLPRGASDVVSPGAQQGEPQAGPRKMRLERWLEAPPKP
jgi:hypothetical protein